MAKIEFDIKYRPQIESGEYKVETRDGRPARITCWNNLDSAYPISAAITSSGSSITSTFTSEGEVVANSKHHLDLFIIIPVPTQIESSADNITEKTINIPIPYGFEAHIKGNKVEIRRKEPELNELAESEDEKIRKTLLRCCDDWGKGQFGCMAKEDVPAIRAYLEKQKEQKPTHTAKEMWKEMRLEVYAQASGNRHEPNYSDDSTKMFSLCDIDEIFDKIGNSTVGSQPTEWSEDYQEEDLLTRFAFYTYKDEDDVLYLSNVFVEETSRNKGFGTKILAAAEKVAETLGAINIRLKVKQNSPANAWYRKNGYGYMAFEEDYDWLEKTLEYLKPSKKEWSEEDDVMLDKVFCLIHPGTKLTEDNADYCVELKQWIGSLRERLLKSLRPQSHWKPNEYVLSLVKKVANGEMLTHMEQMAMETFYDDLQKLL